MQVSAQRAIPILLSLLAVPGLAAPPRWTLLGPDGHDARFLAVAPSNPDVVYATGFAQEGIFRSLDGGATWTPFDQGLADFQGFVNLLTYNAQGTVAYAGTSNGVFQSSGGLPQRQRRRCLEAKPLPRAGRLGEGRRRGPGPSGHGLGPGRIFSPRRLQDGRRWGVPGRFSRSRARSPGCSAIPPTAATGRWSRTASRISRSTTC